ncbi:hypothetical protein Cme02nite_74450 [Catellatospora methionotrophica]|uniref:Uncharacterized protein n=1 Tax=Catellatospora methionotrophica TaxID=121620 RepID=A0A8J3PK29_9ACTN|nr:hypothetical protein [Catellatospora methionotrophica]GIG19113.1 hypothetical protein Cme02nite_74450 [Catellatospora methionotrophica]
MPRPKAAAPDRAFLRLALDLGDAPTSSELIEAVRALTHVYEVGMLAEAARSDTRFRDDALTLLRISERTWDAPDGDVDHESLRDLAWQRYDESANRIVWANPLRIATMALDGVLDLTLTHDAAVSPWDRYGDAALTGVAAAVREIQDFASFVERHRSAPAQRRHADRDRAAYARPPRQPEPDPVLQREQEGFLHRLAEDGFFDPYGRETGDLIVAEDRDKLERSLAFLSRRGVRLSEN